jgi:hypothetical protein
MVFVNILRDGTIFPALNRNEMIVKLLNGCLQVGRYEKTLYLNDSHEYITEPPNAAELKAELVLQINAEMPAMFSRRYAVYFICPKNIADKVEWNQAGIISSNF